MSSINEAIFRGRIRREFFATPPEPHLRNQGPLTQQIMARRAIEAVLAGGYTTCDSESAPTPATPQAPPQHAHISRDLVLWTALFALAGLIGIATSRLPGHAVQARQGARPALANPAAQLTDEIQEAAPPQPAANAAAAPAAQPAAAIVAEQVLRQAAPPVPAPAVVARATISVVPPAPAQATLQPVYKPAAGMAVMPVTPPPAAPSSRAPAAPGEAGRVPLTEVLYEGDPAPASKTVRAEPGTPAQPTARPTRATAPQRREPQEEKATEGAPTGNLPAGAPHVEGIFWDKVRPMALVGGDIVEVGSPVGAYKVTSIQPGMVVLSDGSSQLELRP